MKDKTLSTIMKEKIKEILINRLGDIVKDDVLDELSIEIDQMVRHDEFVKSGKKDNVTIDELIDNTARIGDIFKYGDDYYEIVVDNMECGFKGMNCNNCPLGGHACINLKGFRKI